MKNTARVFGPLAGSIALLLCATAQADSIKAANTTPLNDAGSWTNSIVPGPLDFAIWNSTITAGNTSSLGGDLSVFGLRVGNVGGARNTGSNGVHIGNTAGATLTIGAGGVDMSSALQAFRILSAVDIGANQTWNIANANTAGSPLGLNKNEDFSLSAATAGISFDLAGFEVTKTGAGTAAFALGPTIMSSAPGGAFHLNQGTLVVQSGSSRTTTVTSDVTFNVNSGATLLFGAESGAGGVAVQNGGTVNLNGGTLLMQANQANANNHTGTFNVLADSAWNLTGGSTAPVTFSGNLTGAGNINHANTSTSNRVVLTGDNSGYSGTFTLNGGANVRALRLASDNAGSANAAWVVGAGNTLEIHGFSVQLGELHGEGVVQSSSGNAVVNAGGGDFSGVLANGAGLLALTKVGAGTLTLTGANTYTGTTSVEEGTLITTPAHAVSVGVTVADGATFGVQLESAGTTLVTPSISAGAVTGATLRFATGIHGNPAVPMISTTDFTPVAPTTFDITGTALTTGVARLLDYSGAIGGGGFGSLSVTTPFRISGTLIDNFADTSVDVSLSVETPRWNGDAGPVWDIANTPNWRTLTSNTATQYLQGVNTDQVLFDDNATGTTTVELNGVLTPAPGATVNNDAKTYTFGGSGVLSGNSFLVKNGPGTLILANTVVYDHTGGTEVNAGVLQIGDGATIGAGIIPTGGISNLATVRLNRPDDFSGTILGGGTLVKDQAGTFTLVNSVTGMGAIELAGGTLALAVGGNFSGALSGPGNITSNSGTFEISGTEPNTNTGLTTVAAGTMRFNKPANVDAVGGDVLITGGSTLALLASEQIPDTATITFTGTSGDSLAGAAAGATETIANAVVNPSVATGQFIMRNGFTITGTAQVQNGILGVASSHNATVNAINMTGGLVRIAASAGPSTLTVGSGGITASAGEIQVKFNGNNQDGVLNLGGDFTATGNVLFSNAGYGGANLNVINLNGDRVFDIAEFTTTTVQPDFGGLGGLTKTGGGTLLLTPASTAAHSGPTLVSEGTLEVNGSIVGSNVTVEGGTLAGTGTISPGIGGIFVNAGGKLAPGGPLAPGTLSVNLSAGGTLDIFVGIAGPESQTLDFLLDSPGFSDKVLTSAGPLVIGTGLLEFDDFVFSPGFSFDPGATYTLFDGDTTIVGSLGEQVVGQVAGQFFELQLADSDRDIILVSVPEPGSALLLLCGAGAFVARRRRARSAAR